MIEKLFLGAVLCLFIAGCGRAAKQSEFWKHETVYKNWDHLEFSMWGYKNPTVESGKKSQEQGWWGIPIKQPEQK